MIQFDAKSLQQWKENNIHDITCKVISGGCAGKKVEVLEYDDKSTDMSLRQEDLTIHIDSLNAPLLQDARLSFLKGKWILVSNQINNRCGCGKSFSIKSGNKIQDKIEQMKLAIKTKREGIHHM